MSGYYCYWGDINSKPINDIDAACNRTFWVLKTKETFHYKHVKENTSYKRDSLRTI